MHFARARFITQGFSKIRFSRYSYLHKILRRADHGICIQKIATMCDYPLHLGVTEAGTRRMGLIKSAAGIGSLLMDGIGDTIRVSLTADPVEEVSAGFDILKAVDIKKIVRK